MLKPSPEETGLLIPMDNETLSDITGFEDGALAEAAPLVCTVPENAGKIRLDAFLASETGESRSRIKKQIGQGGCSVDGVPCTDADFRLRPGQVVELVLAPPQESPSAEEGPLDVVYADDSIAVIRKPAGLTMHPCPSCPSGTLVNRMLSRFPQLALQEGPRPGIVHRLDKDTSGLCVIALSERARLRLSEAFAAREVHKTYLAIASGRTTEEGECSLAIGRHPSLKTRMAAIPEKMGGRSALTHWRTLYAQEEGKASLLAVRIFTGRTHQIRVHLAHAGHPLLGDAVYAPHGIAALAPRQMLHAWKLEFRHPVSGKPLEFICPPPQDFTQTLLSLEHGMTKIILTGMPGCGKSAALASLEANGVPVWSADCAVAAQYAPGAEGWKIMRMHWGDAFFDRSGAVDRTKLTTLLREHPDMRRELESVIHPLVHSGMEKFFRDAENAGNAMAAAEVPLWFECGWERPLRSAVAVIACPEEIRHRRLASARGWSSGKIAAVESWQWPQDRKTAAADFVIRNGGTLQDLDREIKRFLQRLNEDGASRIAGLEQTWQGLWNG